MTLADAQLAFPFILLAIGIIAVLGPSFPTLVLVVGCPAGCPYARILRAQVIVLRSREFVEAIHALGGSVARIVLRHVLPNVLSTRGHRHARAGAGHRARGHAVVPRPRHPAAHAVVGRHDLGGPRVSRLGVVDLDLPRPGAHADVAGGQPHRRLAARPARSRRCGESAAMDVEKTLKWIGAVVALGGLALGVVNYLATVRARRRDAQPRGPQAVPDTAARPLHRRRPGRPPSWPRRRRTRRSISRHAPGSGSCTGASSRWSRIEKSRRP